MNIISWNVRGLGGGLKFRAIRKLIRDKKCAFLRLMETKCSGLRESIVRRMWIDDEFN